MKTPPPPKSFKARSTLPSLLKSPSTGIPARGWPFTVKGTVIAVPAEKVPSPLPRKTFPFSLTTSLLPSPLISAVAIVPMPVAEVELKAVIAAPKVPSPLPGSTDRLLPLTPLVATMSNLPSLFTSSTTSEPTVEPTE